MTYFNVICTVFNQINTFIYIINEQPIVIIMWLLTNNTYSQMSVLLSVQFFSGEKMFVGVFDLYKMRYIFTYYNLKLNEVHFQKIYIGKKFAYGLW